MIWRVSFGDGHGGGFRVEWSADEDPMVPGNTADSVRVMYRAPGAPPAARHVRVQATVELLSDNDRTIYD